MPPFRAKNLLREKFGSVILLSMAKELYLVGPKTFSTKKAVIEECRKIRDCYRNLEPIRDSEHVEFLNALVRRHRSADQKVGCGVDYFYVNTNEHGTRGFWLQRVDGTQTDFSWNQCMTPATHEQKVKSSMRYAIRPQIHAFRDTLSFPLTCELSGAPVYPGNCHIDHVVPFDTLVADFFQRENLTMDQVVISQSLDGRVVCEFEDKVLDFRWRQYHQERAQLRGVSDKANLTRPKGEI